MSLPTSRVAWKAPELVSDDPSKPCELSEVYAFCMIVYEILKRQVPYQGIAQLAVSKLVQNDIALVKSSCSCLRKATCCLPMQLTPCGSSSKT